MCLVGGSIFFQGFVRLGTQFNSLNAVHQDCIIFCLMSMLRTELYQVAEMWNQHLIASSKFGNNSGPGWRPDCMSFLRHLFDAEARDYKLPAC